jgi:hypothetical protein
MTPEEKETLVDALTKDMLGNRNSPNYMGPMGASAEAYGPMRYAVDPGISNVATSYNPYLHPRPYNVQDPVGPLTREQRANQPISTRIVGSPIAIARENAEALRRSAGRDSGLPYIQATGPGSAPGPPSTSPTLQAIKENTTQNFLSDMSGLDTGIMPNTRTVGANNPFETAQGFNALNIDLDAISKEAADALKKYNIENPTNPKDPEKTPEELCAAEGGTWNGTSCDLPTGGGKTPEELCVAKGGTWNGTSCEMPQVPNPFDGAAADINSAFNITTQDLTDKITQLVADGKINARLMTADLVQQIKDSADRRNKQIKSIKETSEEALEKQNTNRKAIQTQLSATAKERMATMRADTEAQIAAGRLSLGPQLTSEFEEVAAMVTGLTDSIAAGHEGSMGRIEAVANIAAAQRLAAPALLMADAQSALGDEKFRLENEAQASLLQTLASLTEQENVLVLQEAQRIEAFNNNRDLAEASALVSLGMAKLQNSIDTVWRAEDKAERLEVRLAAEKTAAASAAESKRRWEADFQQKEDTLKTAVSQWNKEFDFQGEQFEWQKETTESATELAKEQAGLSASQKAAQNQLLSSMTAYTPEQVTAMTDTQRNTLFSNVQNNLDDIKRAASVRPGTFRWLVDDLGTDPAIAGMAVAVAEQMRLQDIANEAGDAAGAQSAQDTMDAMLEPYWGLDSTMQRYETADMREIKSLANTAFTALPRLDAPANYEDFGENVYGLWGISDSTRQLEAFVR